MTVHRNKYDGVGRMRRVLELRYLHELTLEEVGNIMGVTRERVRQIEAKALRLLRNNADLRTKALDLLSELDNSR